MQKSLRKSFKEQIGKHNNAEYFQVGSRWIVEFHTCKTYSPNRGDHLSVKAWHLASPDDEFWVLQARQFLEEPNAEEVDNLQDELKQEAGLDRFLNEHRI